MKAIRLFLDLTLTVLNIAAAVILIRKIKEDKELFEREIKPED